MDDKAVDDNLQRLLQASRIRTLMRALSPSIARAAVEYQSDPTRLNSLLDVLQPVCQCLGNIVLEALSLADNGNVCILRDAISGRSVYEVPFLFLHVHKLNIGMRALFVAEKNDAAKGIAAILSRGTSTRRDSRSRFNKIYQFVANIGQNNNCYVAMTSVSGHLLQHDFPPSFKNWTETPFKVLFDAPIQKNVIPGMEGVRTTLIEEVRHCDLLVIWTDCDREGEAIGAEVVSVCTQVKRDLDVYRARFSEITAAAVNRALNNLVRLDYRLVDAVECRSELDLRIGAAFTRLQTLHLRNNFANIFRDKNIISYGSCQFPTLGFIVERYQAIKEFIPEKFWKLSMNHKRNDVLVEFFWNRQRLFDRDVVEILLEDCEETGEARVLSVVKKPKSKWRPVPLDTVELEKLAVRKLKLSAKEAMVTAEKLYNKGFISYPRTETNKFPKDMNLMLFVEQQTVSAEWGDFSQKIAARGPDPRNGSKSDEAHPPIHPLKFATPNELIGLEWSLYEFIVRHFLACISFDAKGQETKVRLGNENFTASGLVVEDYGYLAVYKYETWSDKVLPPYYENEIITDFELRMTEGQTQPPLLLNEADLIALMDKYGIGTDATHAEHIETIKTRQYAALNDDGRFIPGYIGLALVDGYDQMGYAMSKPHMRADLESKLKLICLGQNNKKDVLREQITKYRAIFEQAEVKIQMLSNALRKYLNQCRNVLSADNKLGSIVQVQTKWARTSSNSVVPRNSAPTRRGRSGRSENRDANLTSTVISNSEQVATTNTSDIELLSTLSILHSNARSRGRTTNTTTNSDADRGENQNPAGQGRQCRCKKAAKRLIVKKEGPNHGRAFWTCSKDRNDPSKCKFFEWEGSRNHEAA
ncbi:unnamed protein product [Thelazia callipaeda]|uniref:DNA topoisomerase n=1 Tax=Thelazia callipaeda TaxID=103827 RepID=A0A0N5CP81_THECL|nr:unnamed protein product [Thelazia callipaeda]